MIATLQRGYVVIALAVVLVAGTFGWTMKVDMASPLRYHSAIHTTTSQFTGIRPHVVCPPPPYNCMG